MPTKQSIVIGARGSKLSLAQTKLVADALEAQNPGTTAEIRIIKTQGDVNQAPIPLDTVGKNWFTSEIEDALRRGEIDIAVHSLKDLSPETKEGLGTVTVLKRADPRDVLISKSGKALKDLPSGAIIGTDSIRRKILLLALRPDIVVKSIRGNVDTRIAKLQSEDYDAIVLAAAGLERVGMIAAATEFFDPTSFVPAIGQGILAAQAREDQGDLMRTLGALTDPKTAIAADAEQAFSRAIGGGCKLPIGCYASIDAQTISLHAIMGNAEATHIIRKSTRGDAKNAVQLAESFAKEFLQNNA